MVTPFPKSNLTSLAAQIVSAYVSRNTVSPDALPGLIKSVHLVIGGLGGEAAVPAVAGPKPAVPIKQSVFADYIVCLEDGKKLKSLKRHLQLSFGLTPEDYRKRWGLPSTYPMVAPNYAATGRNSPRRPAWDESCRPRRSRNCRWPRRMTKSQARRRSVGSPRVAGVEKRPP